MVAVLSSVVAVLSSVVAVLSSVVAVLSSVVAVLSSVVAVLSSVVAVLSSVVAVLSSVVAVLSSVVAVLSSVVAVLSSVVAMGTRAELDLEELKQDILDCRPLWALLDKWLGPTKAFKLGQITYRIFSLARDMRRSSTEGAQGSDVVGNRLSIACHEGSLYLFQDADRAVARVRNALLTRPHSEARLCTLEGAAMGIEKLRERSRDLKTMAKNIENDLRALIITIDTIL